MKNIKKFILFGFLFYPLVSFAAFERVKSFLGDFGGLLNDVIGVLFGLSLVFFFWGVAQFVLNAGDQKMRDDGKKKIMWGIVALFVFVSLYGIIALMGNILGVNPGGSSGSGNSSLCLPGTWDQSDWSHPCNN